MQVGTNQNSVQIAMSDVSWGDIIQVQMLLQSGQSVTISMNVNTTFGFENDTDGVSFGDDDAMTF